MGQQLCRSWVPGSYWELGPRFIEVLFVRRAPSQPRGGKRAASGGPSAERRPVGDRWDVAAGGEKVSLISTAIKAVRCTKDGGTGGKAEPWKVLQLRLTLVQVLTSSPPSLPHTRCRYHLPPHAQWRHDVITLMRPTHAGAGCRGPASGLRHRRGAPRPAWRLRAAAPVIAAAAVITAMMMFTVWRMYYRTSKRAHSRVFIPSRLQTSATVILVVTAATVGDQ
jgi:hypothetical protein